MAWYFDNLQSATIKAKEATTTKIHSIQGVTTADTLTPAEAATQINKLFAVAGISVVADRNMKRVQTEEAFES